MSVSIVFVFEISEKESLKKSLKRGPQENEAKGPFFSFKIPFSNNVLTYIEFIYFQFSIY